MDFRPPQRKKIDLPDGDDHLFQLEHFALFDMEQGLKACGSIAMLVELLTLMISSEIPHDLEQMKRAFEASDFAQVEYVAHKIKGGAMYVGTVRMKYACQYLERYWKSGERKLFNALFHQAVEIIRDTREYLIDWLKQHAIDSRSPY